MTWIDTQIAIDKYTVCSPVSKKVIFGDVALVSYLQWDGMCHQQTKHDQVPYKLGREVTYPELYPNGGLGWPIQSFSRREELHPGLFRRLEGLCCLCISNVSCNYYLFPIHFLMINNLIVFWLFSIQFWSYYL